MADTDKALDEDLGIGLSEDDKYLAEGRKDKKAKKGGSSATTLSWRFHTGLSLIFFGLGVQAVPIYQVNWVFWVIRILGAVVQIGACILFFQEFTRFRPASSKRWKTYLLAGLVFLALAGGVATGVSLTQYSMDDPEPTTSGE